MLCLATVIVSLTDFTIGMSEADRYRQFNDFTMGKYALTRLALDQEGFSSKQVFTRMGFFSPTWYQYIEVEFQKSTYDRRSRFLFACTFIDTPPSDAILQYAASSLVGYSTNHDSKSLLHASLEFYLVHGRERDSSMVANALNVEVQNSYHLHHRTIELLHKIGTPAEIAVIDKAKENGLLSDDGKFWIKAADAKKAILARAEAKKKSELKAKPLDK